MARTITPGARTATLSSGDADFRRFDSVTAYLVKKVIDGRRGR
jgi:hypothetical protein